MKNETSQTTEPAIVVEPVLSSVVVAALQNDKRLIDLHKQLNELHSKAMPKIIQVSPTEVKATYGDEFNELIATIHQEINFRQEQIVSGYNGR